MIRRILSKIKGRILGRPTKQHSNFWQGDYGSWSDAVSDSEGYASDNIFQKSKEAYLQVLKGEALFERDSVLFHQPDYNYPLIAALSHAAADLKKLKILDFGGSFASSYYQNKRFMDALEVDWYVVDQPQFVNFGKKNTKPPVQFFESLEEVMKTGEVNVLLLSSVLPYLESPYNMMESFLTFDIPYLIIDRNPFCTCHTDLLTVQTVPETIYKGRYPAWFFNESKLLTFVEQKYEMISTFEPYPGYTIPLGEHVGYYKGFFLKKK